MGKLIIFLSFSWLKIFLKLFVLFIGMTPADEPLVKPDFSLKGKYFFKGFLLKNEIRNVSNKKTIS